MVTTPEIIRLILFPILGAIGMFVLQPILYQSQIIRLTDVKPQVWVNNHYFPAAIIVFAVAIFTALGWCAINTLSPPPGMAECKKRAAWWWMFLGIPLSSIGIAIFLSRQGILAPKGSNDATTSLICLFFVDVVWLYWLTTATSTPGLAKFTPPLSGLFRK